MKTASRTAPILHQIQPGLFLAWAFFLWVQAGPGSAATVPVRLEVREPGHTALLPCRMHLSDTNSKPVRPSGYPFWHDHFVFPGRAELELAPGHYDYVLERGPEYESMVGSFDLAPTDQEKTIFLTLPRLIELSKEGWWSGELHVHRPPREVELLMRAEDLHIAPVITWWNRRNPWSNQPLPESPLISFDENRFYHLLGGEDEREGGALLYFNLGKPLAIQEAAREYPSPMTFLRTARQNPTLWVDIEKPFWWDAPVWAASGMVDSIGLANNHMCRSQMLENEAWGRPRDSQRLPAPRGNGFWSQTIYYHLLNAGLRLPPSAGSASGVLPNPVGYNRVYVHLGKEPLTYAGWWEGLRAGRSFVSNGPLLRTRANGQLPGHIFTKPAQEDLTVEIVTDLISRDPVSYVEIIKNGQIIKRIPCAHNRWDQANLGTITFAESGWFLVRVIADTPHTFRFASTGPYYIEMENQPRRISRSAVEFFLDWIKQRMGRIRLEDPRQRDEVLGEQQKALEFWGAQLVKANAP